MPSAGETLSSKPERGLVDGLEAIARRLARGDAEGAASKAKALVDDHPFSPGAWFLLGTALLRSQNARAAPACAGAGGPGPAGVRCGSALAAVKPTKPVAGTTKRWTPSPRRSGWPRMMCKHHVNLGRLLLLLRRPDAGYPHVRRAMSLILARAVQPFLEAAVVSAACSHQVAAGLIRRRGRGGLPVAMLEVLAERAQRQERFATATHLAAAALRWLPNDSRLQTALGRALLAGRDFVPATRALRDALTHTQTILTY